MDCWRSRKSDVSILLQKKDEKRVIESSRWGKKLNIKKIRSGLPDGILQTKHPNFG
jgi:hypothetical protein